MNNTAAFDILAPEYDASFTESRVGQSQRKLVHHWLMEYLQDRKGLNILEINCGTGVDARWLSSLGHKVVATDASAEMIRLARGNSGADPEFFQIAFEDLADHFKGERFDMIFSNFAGLNCLSRQDATELLGKLYSLLTPGGHLAFVVFGKYCLWEQLYYLARLQPAKAFRRMKTQVQVRLKDHVFQEVHYFKARQIIDKGKYTVKNIRPVGLFIPPSYLEEMIRKRPKLFKALKWLEGRISPSIFSNLADHCFVLLKRNP